MKLSTRLNMISVIVPVYNVEKWLRRCIDSILAQTFTDFELLLIDDGSTDTSGVICDEYAEKDSRIHVFHTPNSGVSDTRNTGLSNARGEWITFIDSDDWVDEDYLMSLMKVDDKAEFRLSPFWMEFPNGMSSIGIGNMYFGRTITIQQLLDISNRLLWNICCKLYKNNIINSNNLRFETGFDLGEDTFFNYKYLSKIRYAAISQHASYHYRQENQNSLSKKIPTFETMDHFLRLVENTLKQIPKDIDITIARYTLISFYVQKVIYICPSRSYLRKALSKPIVREFLAGPHISRSSGLIAFLFRLRLYKLGLFYTRKIRNPF